MGGVPNAAYYERGGDDEDPKTPVDDRSMAVDQFCPRQWWIPYCDPPEKAVDESIRNLRFGFELLARVPRDELRECFVTSDAIKISQLMRRMLEGS